MKKPKLPAIFHPTGGRVVLQGNEDADPSDVIQRIFRSLLEEGTPQAVEQASLFRRLIAQSQVQAYLEQMAPAFLPFLPVPPLVIPKGVFIRILETMGLEVFTMDDEVYRPLAARGLMKDLRQRFDSK